LLCSSCCNCWMVAALTGTGGEGGPPPTAVMLVLAWVVRCLCPLAFSSINSPNRKSAVTVVPSTLNRTMPPRTDTEPVGV